MIQQIGNTLIMILLAKFMLNDVPHAMRLGLSDRPTWYIKSKPPAEPFLYHHALYSGLKRIATRWAIEAPPGKDTISLTTDAGRYLSPLPFMTFTTVDGVVKMPYTEELRGVTIPALYQSHSQEQVNEVRAQGYMVYAEGEVPPEYRYIMKFVVHSSMFIGENEYTVIARYLDVPVSSVIYIHPAKLKRFKAGLSQFSMKDIRSLEELAR